MGSSNVGGAQKRSARPLHIIWADNKAGMRGIRKRTGTAWGRTGDPGRDGQEKYPRVEFPIKFPPGISDL